MCDNEGRKDGRSKLRHKVPANHDPPTGHYHHDRKLKVIRC